MSVSTTRLELGRDLEATVATLSGAQCESGMIPWYEGGHCDPWNHVEVAMALSAGGLLEEAGRALSWLAAVQLENGAWCNYFWPDGSVKDHRLDSNVCAYPAAGLWQYYLASSDAGAVAEFFPMVDRAISFVCSLQRPGGELVWSVRPDGRPESYALLTGSASAYFSLRCALFLAEVLGVERPGWEAAAGRLAHAVVHRTERFAPKHRYAMDWYYPVLTSACDRESATARMNARSVEFVMEGFGVRCVRDRPWVTTAETAECAIAYVLSGEEERAEDLLSWLEDQREEDGRYTTGRVYPERASFPAGERSTYGAAAVVLAWDALRGTSPTSGLFSGRSGPRA